MSKDKVKTKPPMAPGPEADGHNQEETVVPRKPMTAEEPIEPVKAEATEVSEPEPVEDKVAEAEAEVTEPPGAEPELAPD